MQNIVEVDSEELYDPLLWQLIRQAISEQSVNTSDLAKRNQVPLNELITQKHTIKVNSNLSTEYVITEESNIPENLKNVCTSEELRSSSNKTNNTLSSAESYIIDLYTGRKIPLTNSILQPNLEKICISNLENRCAFKSSKDISTDENIEPISSHSAELCSPKFESKDYKVYEHDSFLQTIRGETGSNGEPTSTDCNYTQFVNSAIPCSIVSFKNKKQQEQFHNLIAKHLQSTSADKHENELPNKAFVKNNCHKVFHHTYKLNSLDKIQDNNSEARVGYVNNISNIQSTLTIYSAATYKPQNLHDIPEEDEDVSIKNMKYMDLIRNIYKKIDKLEQTLTDTSPKISQEFMAFNRRCNNDNDSNTTQDIKVVYRDKTVSLSDRLRTDSSLNFNKYSVNKINDDSETTFDRTYKINSINSNIINGKHYQNSGINLKSCSTYCCDSSMRDIENIESNYSESTCTNDILKTLKSKISALDKILTVLSDKNENFKQESSDDVLLSEIVRKLNEKSTYHDTDSPICRNEKNSLNVNKNNLPLNCSEAEVTCTDYDSTYAEYATTVSDSQSDTVIKSDNEVRNYKECNCQGDVIKIMQSKIDELEQKYNHIASLQLIKDVNRKSDTSIINANTTKGKYTPKNVTDGNINVQKPVFDKHKQKYCSVDIQHSNKINTHASNSETEAVCTRSTLNKSKLTETKRPNVDENYKYLKTKIPKMNNSTIKTVKEKQHIIGESMIDNKGRNNFKVQNKNIGNSKLTTEINNNRYKNNSSHTNADTDIKTKNMTVTNDRPSNQQERKSNSKFSPNYSGRQYKTSQFHNSSLPFNFDNKYPKNKTKAKFIYQLNTPPQHSTKEEEEEEAKDVPILIQKSVSQDIVNPEHVIYNNPNDEELSTIFEVIEGSDVSKEVELIPSQISAVESEKDAQDNVSEVSNTQSKSLSATSFPKEADLAEDFEQKAEVSALQVSERTTQYDVTDTPSILISKTGKTSDVKKTVGFANKYINSSIEFESTKTGDSFPGVSEQNLEKTTQPHGSGDMSSITPATKEIPDASDKPSYENKIETSTTETKSRTTETIHVRSGEKPDAETVGDSEKVAESEASISRSKSKASGSSKKSSCCAGSSGRSSRRQSRIITDINNEDNISRVSDTSSKKSACCGGGSLLSKSITSIASGAITPDSSKKSIGCGCGSKRCGIGSTRSIGGCDNKSSVNITETTETTTRTVTEDITTATKTSGSSTKLPRRSSRASINETSNTITTNTTTTETKTTESLTNLKQTSDASTQHYEIIRDIIKDITDISTKSRTSIDEPQQTKETSEVAIQQEVIEHIVESPRTSLKQTSDASTQHYDIIRDIVTELTNFKSKSKISFADDEPNQPNVSSTSVKSQTAKSESIIKSPEKSPSVSLKETSEVAIQPDVVEESPTVSLKEPSEVAIQPDVVEKSPTVSLKEPSEVAIQPEVVEESPTVSLKETSEAAIQPEVVEESPTVSLKEPSEVAIQPDIVEESPTVSVKEPSVVTIQEDIVRAPSTPRASISDAIKTSSIHVTSTATQVSPRVSLKETFDTATQYSKEEIPKPVMVSDTPKSTSCCNGCTTTMVSETLKKCACYTNECNTSSLVLQLQPTTPIPCCRTNKRSNVTIDFGNICCESKGVNTAKNCVCCECLAKPPSKLTRTTDSQTIMTEKPCVNVKENCEKAVQYDIIDDTPKITPIPKQSACCGTQVNITFVKIKKTKGADSQTAMAEQPCVNVKENCEKAIQNNIIDDTPKITSIPKESVGCGTQVDIRFIKIKTTKSTDSQTAMTEKPCVNVKENCEKAVQNNIIDDTPKLTSIPKESVGCGTQVNINFLKINTTEPTSTTECVPTPCYKKHVQAKATKSTDSQTEMTEKPFVNVKENCEKAVQNNIIDDTPKITSTPKESVCCGTQVDITFLKIKTTKATSTSECVSTPCYKKHVQPKATESSPEVGPEKSKPTIKETSEKATQCSCNDIPKIKNKSTSCSDKCKNSSIHLRYKRSRTTSTTWRGIPYQNVASKSIEEPKRSVSDKMVSVKKSNKALGTSDCPDKCEKVSKNTETAEGFQPKVNDACNEVLENLARKIAALEEAYPRKELGRESSICAIKDLEKKIEALENACVIKHLDKGTIKDLEEKFNAFENVCPRGFYNVDSIRNITNNIRDLEKSFDNSKSATSQTTASDTENLLGFKINGNYSDTFKDKVKKTKSCICKSLDYASKYRNGQSPPALISEKPVLHSNVHRTEYDVLDPKQHKLMTQISLELENQLEELKSLKLILQSHLNQVMRNQESTLTEIMDAIQNNNKQTEISGKNNLCNCDRSTSVDNIIEYICPRSMKCCKLIKSEDTTDHLNSITEQSRKSTKKTQTHKTHDDKEKRGDREKSRRHSKDRSEKGDKKHSKKGKSRSFSEKSSNTVLHTTKTISKKTSNTSLSLRSNSRSRTKLKHAERKRHTSSTNKKKSHSNRESLEYGDKRRSGSNKRKSSHNVESSKDLEKKQNNSKKQLPLYLEESSNSQEKKKDGTQESKNIVQNPTNQDITGKSNNLTQQENDTPKTNKKPQQRPKRKNHWFLMLCKLCCYK